MVCSYRQVLASISGGSARTVVALALTILGSACSGGGSSAPQSQGPQLLYEGATTWTISGPQGGPFVNASHDFTLENTGSDPISWSASSIPAFLVLDQPSGVVQPGAQVVVHADLLASMANSLPPGNSSGPLTFRNDTGSQPDIVIDCTLSVADAGSQSNLAPSNNCTFQGPAGGPFTPVQAVYTLFNIGSGPLSWQAVPADSWLAVQPSSGQLASGASIDLVVSVDSSHTSSLQPGTYGSRFDVLSVPDMTMLHTRDVGLVVA